MNFVQVVNDTDYKLPDIINLNNKYYTATLELSSRAADVLIYLSNNPKDEVLDCDLPLMLLISPTPKDGWDWININENWMSELIGCLECHHWTNTTSNNTAKLSMRQELVDDTFGYEVNDFDRNIEDLRAMRGSSRDLVADALSKMLNVDISDMTEGLCSSQIDSE